MLALCKAFGPGKKKPGALSSNPVKFTRGESCRRVVNAQEDPGDSDYIAEVRLRCKGFVCHFILFAAFTSKLALKNSHVMIRNKSSASGGKTLRSMYSCRMALARASV